MTAATISTTGYLSNKVTVGNDMSRCCAAGMQEDMTATAGENFYNKLTAGDFVRTETWCDAYDCATVYRWRA